MAESAATRLTIDLGALTRNHAVLRREAAGAEVSPVLKADGYGLGAGIVGARLWDDGARTFFVARLSEGEALRTALTPDRPATIYVLDGFTTGSGARLAAADLTPALSTLPRSSAAQAWGPARGSTCRRPAHRHGHEPTGRRARPGRALVQSIDRLRGLEVGLVMSHLGSAESPQKPRNADQLARFLEVRPLFPQARASLSASAGRSSAPTTVSTSCALASACSAAGPRSGRTHG
jgi:alanine racemase